MNFVAQVVGDYGQLMGQYGFAGMLCWVIVKRLDRIEHVVAGLSKALWFDIAARPSADKFIKDQAKKVIAEMERDKK
jgi:hypothetical protein